MEVLGLAESAEAAIRVFRPFTDEPADLVPLGMGPVDRAIGGLFRGACGILAAATGVGKSSLVLASALQSSAKVGIVSTEDTPDVVGSRVLSWASGVDSLKLRTKQLSDEDKQALTKAKNDLSGEDGVAVAYTVGGSLGQVIEAVRALADKGCQLVWLDYIQKVRGLTDNRRNEVGTVYTTFQRTCSEVGVAAMAVSQFRREVDHSRPPQIWWLKESGDLENEARLIILAHRDGAPDTLSCRIAKSTFGGEGVSFQLRRDSSGTLREVDPREETF